MNERKETNSSLACFQTCKRKYYFRYEMLLSPLDERKELKIGSVVHDAISKYLTGEKPVDLLKYIVDKMREGIKDAIVDQSIITDDESVALNCFTRFVESFDENSNFFNIEKEFSMAVYHPFTQEQSTIEILGKFDGGIIIDGKFWIMEHKTTSMMKKLIEGLPMAPQALTYLMAVPLANGVMYNIMQKKRLPEKPEVLKSGKLSKNKTQNTSYKLYIEAIEEMGLNPDDYQDILEHLKNKKPDFKQVWLSPSDEQKVQFQLSLFETLKDLERTVNSNVWPRNYHACSSHFGRCPFFEACSSDNPESVIENNFKVREKKHEEISGGVE